MENLNNQKLNEIPLGSFRALLTECREDEIVEGRTAFFMKMALYSFSGCISVFCEDSFLNHVGLPKTRDFFALLDVAGITWENFFDLEGMVIEGEVIYELVGNALVPTITYQKVVAPPPRSL